jgi:NAD+ synthase
MGALGPGRVLTVTVDLGLPEHREQTSWASSVAAELGLPHRIVKADGVLDHLLSLVPERGSFSEVNVMTRVIHGVIFQVADGTAATVASTVNRSEQTLGRHMEHYYGHVTPLASLWKTEVREVARRLDVPQRVINRPSGCAEAWWDYEVLGADWDEVDAFLQSGITEDTDWGGRMKRRVANAQLRGFAAPAKART